MRGRCGDVKHRSVPHYGGLGVRVCKRWSSFLNFLVDMGERPEDKTLGRFLDKGNYTPTNCKWMTRTEQENGKAVCPKCKQEMAKQPFTKSDKLYTCESCGFKVPTSKTTTTRVTIDVDKDTGEILEERPMTQEEQLQLTEHRTDAETLIRQDAENEE